MCTNWQQCGLSPPRKQNKYFPDSSCIHMHVFILHWNALQLSIKQVVFRLYGSFYCQGTIHTWLFEQHENRRRLRLSPTHTRADRVLNPAGKFMFFSFSSIVLIINYHIHLRIYVRKQLLTSDLMKLELVGTLNILSFITVTYTSLHPQRAHILSSHT